MEGRISLRFRKLNIYGKDRVCAEEESDKERKVCDEEFTMNHLTANDYLSWRKAKDLCNDDMKLVALQCETRSAKIIRLPHSVFDLLSNMKSLQKDALEEFILKINKPMDTATDKA